jgi:FG-GAP-like repeat
MSEAGVKGSRARSIRAASLAAGLAGLIAASAAYGFGAFGTPPNSTTTGSAHYWAEVLDYDGDTDGDLVVADYEDDEIEAYPGNGDGTFGAPQSIQLPDDSGPNGIAVGEFVGDDRKDLAVTNYNGNSISILRGTSGGFDVKRTFDAKPKRPYPIVARDLDRDGLTDLVVAGGNGSDAAFYSYLGMGNGRFDQRHGSVGGTAIYGLGLAKLDRDGKLDAIGATGGGRVLVLLGGKNGQFIPWYFPQISNSEIAWDALTIGDFNEDGKQDAVVGFVNKFVLMRGRGDRYGRFFFKPPRNFPASGVEAIEGGDFNEDGHLDVALANANGISVALGDGEGHFDPLAPYGGGLAAPVFLGSGKINGDAGVDLVRGAETGFDVYLNLDN